MTTIEKRLFEGARAKEVLENEAFIASFEAIEKEITEQWKQSPARDQEGREKCWQYLMLLQKVKAHLTMTMETGKLAQLEVHHKTTREKLAEFISR
jgi:hypothetical protein